MAKILLVDDNAELLEFIAGYLLGAGHAVNTAADGKEAMRLVQSNTYDLVITDVLMPEKEGLETIMELHKINRKTKIIAMSGGGYGGASDYLDAARILGAAKTLAKPFSGKELLQAVDDVLAG